MSDARDRLTPARPFPLLALPDDLVALVCHFVALQRYDYSESRRPKPSPLSTLAHAHSRLHPFATPLLHRRSWLDPRPAAITHSRKHLRFLQATLGEIQTARAIENVSGGGPLEGCRTLELIWLSHGEDTDMLAEQSSQLGSLLRSCPDIATIHLRRPKGSPPTAVLTAYRRLRTFTAFLPEPAWLPVLTLIPHATHASFSLKENTPPLCTWAVPAFWSHIHELELETAPRRPGSSVHPVEDLLARLRVPAHSSLRRLKVAVRLQLQVTPLKGELSLLVECLKPFADLPLTELAIDEFASAAPQTIAALAKLFPSLERLAFGSRTGWEGPAEVYFDALSRFAQLRELECPRWPEVQEPWRAAEEMLAELAVALPKLELVGLSGRQSRDEWYRIPRGRDEGGRSSRVERVTLYNTDLDQCR